MSSENWITKVFDQINREAFEKRASRMSTSENEQIQDVGLPSVMTSYIMLVGMKMDLDPESPKNTKILKRISLPLQLEEKRLRHALARLKDKKLYRRTFNELFEKLSKESQEYSELCRLLAIQLMEISEVVDDEPIPDKLWYEAIETVMCVHHYSVYADTKKAAFYGPFLSNHIHEIYTYLLLYAIRDYVLCLENEYDGEIDRLNDVIDDQKATIRELQLDPLSQENKKLKEEIQLQELKIAQLQRMLQTESARADGHAKELAELERQFAEQIPTARKNVSQFEGLLNYNALSENNSDSFNDISISSKQIIELPEKGVLFLGGHQNMLNKLQNLYSKWDFRNEKSGALRFNKNTSIEYVFIWSNHLSHALYYQALNTLPGNPPVFYVKSTNIEKLVEEMTDKYNEYLQKQGYQTEKEYDRL